MENNFPDGWDLLPLENCMEKIIDYRGKTPRKSPFGIPLITAKIVKNGRIDEPNEFIPYEDYDDRMQRGIPKAGDIVVTTEAPLGEVGQLDNRKLSVGQRLITLRGKVGLLDNTYLKFLMMSEFVQNQLHSRATGTTVIGIKQRELRKISLAVPPLHEQRAIAGILGALDDKIELNRRMNRTLESMARAVFREWFVESEEVGDWDVGRLDDLLVLQRGFDLPAPQRIPGKYPVVAASGPSGTHNLNKVKGPGVTTGRSGVIGQVFFVHEDFWPLNTSLWVKEFKLSKPAFAYFLLNTLDFTMFNSGSAVPTLNRNHVHNLPLSIPPQDLIERFENYAMPLLDLVCAKEKESRTLASLRDSLLPKLMSGKIRIQS